MSLPPLPVTIRFATADDVPAMVALLDQLFTLERDFTPNPQRQRTGLDLLLAQSGAKIWVAELDPGVVAMVSLQTVISTAEGGPVGWVEDLIVADPWRGLGIGSRLLASVENWAKANGLSRLQLLADRANSPALDFYAANGWVLTQLGAVRKLFR